MTTKPLLCIVTDRTRLSAVHGRAATGIDLLLRQIEAAVAAGIDLVHIRERDLGGRELAALVCNAVAAARGSQTRIVVNDRVDVALATGAGVHLRAASISAADVRRVAPTALVGRSVHSANDVPVAGPVDYVIAGTVFPTRAKSGEVRPIREAGLGEIVRAAGSTPVIAIGGIDVDTARGLARTGVRGLAAVGAFLPASDRQDVRQAVQEAASALRMAFDDTTTAL